MNNIAKPETYDFIRFKKMFKVVSKKNKDPNVLLLAATQNRGIIPKSDVGYRTVTISDENFENLKLVRKGNFCITLRSFQGGIEYSEYDGAISTGYTVLKTKRKCVAKYYKYFLKNSNFINDLNKYKFSIRDGQNISFQDLSYELIQYPSISEQTSIANFLDHHVSRIDRQTNLLEQKAERLEEYRQALIYETVTKGLNRDATMKASGVEWIGNIPSHWEVKALKFLLTKKNKTLNTISAKPLSLSFGKVVYKKTEVLDETLNSYQLVKPGQILINPLNLNFDLKSLRIGISNYSGCASSGYIVVNVKYNHFKNYINYLLHIFDVLELKNLGGGVRQTVSFEMLKNQSLLDVPIAEQTEIANFLDTETSKIDSKVALIRKKVELLKEYKQSLIYEAVTGKIDVNTYDAKAA